MIYYLLGKSASGKDTIYKRLRSLKPEWKEVTPYTTRPIREGETDGVEYHFVSDIDMDNFETSGKMIEERTYQTVYGPWRYGTVDDGQIDISDNSDYLMIGVLQSFISIRNYFGAKNITPIYIEVPDDLRYERARKREMLEKTPKYDELERRFKADNVDFSDDKLEKAGIVKRYQNIVIEECINEIIKDTAK